MYEQLDDVTVSAETDPVYAVQRATALSANCVVAPSTCRSGREIATTKRLGAVVTGLRRFEPYQGSAVAKLGDHWVDLLCRP